MRLLEKLQESPVRALYGELPPAERFHVWARDLGAPLEAVAERAPAGKIADIGCGHGLLTALLAQEHPERQVVGVDPDVRKIAHARAALSQLSNVRFEQGTSEALALREAGTFDAVVVVDVLYLLPVDEWVKVLAQAHALLRPGGVLLLKEARGDKSWKHLKCLAQEWLMVRLLGRTHGSGGLGFMPQDEMRRLLLEAGFPEVAVTDLSHGFTTPHVLYEARKEAR